MAEIVDFGLQQHKIKMDSRYFDNVLSVVAGDTGRRIEVQLLDTNGMVQDTTGLNLRLNAVIAGKATYTDATLVDAATGKYQLDLSNGMFLAPGDWQFQWQITDSAGKKLHSFAFTGNVGSNISEGGSQATNFYLNLEDLKAMQDDLVNGTFNSEALETNIARKLEALEQTYAPRLTEVTAQLEQNLKFGNQEDFVELVSRLVEYDEMYYKRENTLGWITIALIKGNEHISWIFRNNTYDDFIILGDCFSGSVTRSLQIYQNENYETITGTGWVTTAPNAHYTTVVGDTITNYIEGEKIEFHHYADNRGGVWEFVIDDVIDKPILISTWSETVIATNNKTIIEGLPYGTHKVVATFKGDDPAHVPSTGVGTSRGWVYVNGENNYLTFRSYKTQIKNNRDKDLLVGFSNKEFAFQMRKSGVGTHQFVPMHNNIGTAFEVEPEKILADGTVVDVMSLVSGEFFPCNEFKVIQKVYATNPDAPSENLATISTNVTITKKGLVEILGKMDVLTSIDISEGYGIMFPASKPVISRMLTSIDNEYPCTATDGSRTTLTEEKDKTGGFILTSNVEKDYVLACRVNDVHNSLRTGESGKYPEGNTAWLEHRDTNMTKLYQSVFKNATLSAGVKYKWGGTFACAKIPSIHDVV